MHSSQDRDYPLDIAGKEAVTTKHQGGVDEEEEQEEKFKWEILFTVSLYENQRKHSLQEKLLYCNSNYSDIIQCTKTN